jgi:hypothetical protein
MTGSGRIAAGMALAVAALVSMTACGSDSSSGPGTLPPLSAPPSTSPSLASPAPSTSAAGGKKAELAAATAVVRRYFAVVNELHEVMDAKSLAAIFASSCPCQQQVRAIKSAGAEGQHFVDHATINALRTNRDGLNLADVLADFNSSAGGLVNSHGHHVTSTKAKKHVRWVFDLRRFGSRWLITSIEAIS